MPPYGDGWVKDVTGQACPLVDAKRLDGLVGIKIGDLAVERGGRISGMEGVEENSTQWVIARAKAFQWSQSLLILIEPSGKCLASIRFAPFGA